MTFSYQPLPVHTTFATGDGARALRQTLAMLDLRRVLVIAEPADANLASCIAAATGAVAAVHATQVRPGPGDNLAEVLTAAARRAADGLVCIGPGRIIELGKLASAAGGQPLVALPTDYSGTEMASGAPAVPVRAVVYDAHLVKNLPRHESVAAGLRILSQCIETFWAPGANPVAALLAEEGIRSIAAGLREVRRSNRERLQYGAHLAGSAVSMSGTGLLDRLSRTLSERFLLPPDQVCAVLLPQLLAVNAPAMPAAAERIAGALGLPALEPSGFAVSGQADGAWPAMLESGFAVAGLHSLYEAIGAPRSFIELGLRKWHLAEALEAAAAAGPVPNPVKLDRHGMARLLRGAFRPVERPGLVPADLDRRLEGIAS